MSADPLMPIRDALNAGDKKAAQKMLRPLLNDHPTAEMWRLAAQACTTNEKAIECLRRAVALDPFHDGANRLLFKLESAQSMMLVVEEQPSMEMLTAPTHDLVPVRAAPDEAIKPTEARRGKKKSHTTRNILLLSLFLFGAAVSVLTLNMIGVISGPITTLTMMMGGAAPVKEIDGVPISEVEAASTLISPSHSEPLVGRDTDVLEPGYQHEYTFEGRFGQEAAIYVQFLSLAANRVSRNVVLLRPDGTDATAGCIRDTILQGDNNIALTCPLDATGEWKVRILGRDGESVGAYFVGIEQMGGL